jgi:outer membrane lipoprotein carrier protein
VFYNQGDIVWKYIYPYKKIIWVKDKVYVYEPDIMQLTIAKRKNNTLSDILKHSKKVKDHLYKAKIENKTVYFIYDKTLKKIFYTDEVGNKVNIVFYNQKNNAPKNVFKLTYPQDVDVIYQN